MNKRMFVVFMVLLLVLPVLCVASSGGSGYQERDRSGWLQSNPSVGGGGLLGPGVGEGLKESKKDVETGLLLVEPLPYAQESILERFYPWSVFGLILVFVGFLVIFYKLLEWVGDYFRAKYTRGHL